MLESETYQKNLTPKKIVLYLDKYIIGQKNAKRSVAVALRNRWRRRMVSDEMRDEIMPKNIILIGSTGIGKTEIARRMAKLVNAPFIKVEASKYTEIGYVGRDVESMVRDLTEIGMSIVRKERMEKCKEQAGKIALERVIDILLPPVSPNSKTSPQTPDVPSDERTRTKFRDRILNGEINEKTIQIETSEKVTPGNIEIFPMGGNDPLGSGFRDMMSGLMPNKETTRKVTIAEALRIFRAEEAEKLIGEDQQIEAVRRVEESGIIFLDEIDKVANSSVQKTGEVSREGVQRDLLPIVEGCTVNTRLGVVKTDHILFIAAGAFHVSKPSDLIPELQGRFPIRVELESLTKDDFLKILTKPDNSLTKQYEELLKTENVTLDFTEEALEEIADSACLINEENENIGARRLHTILERILEEISFDASEKSNESVSITREYVREKLKPLMENQDLSKYIL